MGLSSKGEDIVNNYEENHHSQILLEQCRNNLGERDFFQPFLELVKELKSVQVGIWSHKHDVPKCLFIRNLENPIFGEVAKSIYMTGWYKQDPLIDKLTAQKKGTIEIMTHSQVKGLFSDEFLLAFASILQSNNPLSGFADRISILAALPDMPMIIHFYFQKSEEVDLNHPLLPKLIELITQHFPSAPQLNAVFQEAPHPALSNLSDREREVCIGILSGKKAERIAADMEVAPSTVVTYRKRAYEKLGISSRASLFDLCGS